MRQYIVSPIIGGLVAIIVVGLFMHDGASSLGRGRTSMFTSNYQPSSCNFNFSASTESPSPTLVRAVISNGVHC
jgi:hypothetical protein